MEATLLFILLPGLIAFGLNKILKGIKSQPIDEVLVDLVLHTMSVIVIYFLVSKVTSQAPSFSNLIVDYKKLQTQLPDQTYTEISNSFEKSFLILFCIALLNGMISAIASEKKWIQNFFLFKNNHLFQSNAIDSDWKETFQVGSYECWVQFVTKGGILFRGRTHKVSRDHKDGGFGLYNVHRYCPDTNDFVKEADYLYAKSEDIEEPILFIKD